jgi:hypothetical protein
MAQQRTATFWQDHIEAWKQSGLTQAAYCRNHGLHVKSFGRKLSKGRAAHKSSTLPLTLVPASVIHSVTLGTVRLHSPGGWRIELSSGNVTGLVDLLRQ